MNTSTKNSATNVFSNIAKNAQEATSTLADQVNSLATNLAKSANLAVNAGFNAINSATTTAANAANNAMGALNSSMLPLNNSGRNQNVAYNNSFSNIVNATNTAVNNAVNAALNTNTKTKPMWFWVAIVFILVASVVVGVMVFYKDQVARAFATMGSWFKPPAPPAPAPVPEVDLSGATMAEEPPSDGSILSKGAALLGKIMPGKKEVFNINANEFTYYDAEPMCRALGAELATYDQVMEAWKKGANWCNYGWTKGQLAVYPTQKDFYSTLQSGPPEDQEACGTPGVNGGFFDNPEMKFGVNCYGAKPAQTQNDVRLLEERGVLPQTPETLKLNQQAQAYKERIGSIGVLPFSDNKWSEY